MIKGYVSGIRGDRHLQESKLPQIVSTAGFLCLVHWIIMKNEELISQHS